MMGIIFFYISFVSFILKSLNAFEYSLPGDPSWPTLYNFTSFRSNIQGKVMLRGENGYTPHTWNQMTNTPKPAMIVQPMSAQDVKEALKFARTFKLRISVQSTGHHQDHRNIYDNGVHIDMSSMTHKSIDLKAKTLTLGSGNNFSQIQAFVAQASNSTLVAACGADPGVNIYLSENMKHMLKL
jgi:FAD/FMN-containing dehydrogenase